MSLPPPPPPHETGSDARILASTSASTVSTPTAASFAARAASGHNVVTTSTTPFSAVTGTEPAMGFVDGRRQSEGRPHVPRLETDAAALGLAPPARVAKDDHQASATVPLASASDLPSKQQPASSSSKTGAFFGSNGGISSTPILPASASSSSSFAGWASHRRDTSGTSSSSATGANTSFGGGDMSNGNLGTSSSTFSIGSLDSVGGTSAAAPDGTALARHGSSGRAASGRWAGGFGSSLQTPSTGDLSSASSTRSRRVWEEFEGKPITPLPSPGAAAAGQAAALGYFESRMPGLGAKESAATSRNSLETQARPYDSRSGAAPGLQGEDPTTTFCSSTNYSTLEAETPISRNKAFFGSSAPSPLGQTSSPVSSTSSLFASAPPKPTPAPAPSRGATAPRIASGGGSWLARGGAAPDELMQSDGERLARSPLTPASVLSNDLRQPSRLPTLPTTGMPIAGTFSSSSPSSSSSLPSTSRASAAQAPVEGLPASASAHAHLAPWVRQSPPPSTTTRAFVHNPQVALDERMSSLPSAAFSAERLGRTTDAERTLLSTSTSTSTSSGPILTPETQFARIGVSDPPMLEPAPPRSRNGSSQSASESVHGSGHRDSLLLPASASASAFASASASTLGTPAQRRGGASRHVHGPSENATGSSLLPVAAVNLVNSSLSTAAVHDERGGERRQSSAGVAPEEVELDEDVDAGRVGQYVVERTLGMGAFSRVVLARRIRPDSSSGAAASGNRARVEAAAASPPVSVPSTSPTANGTKQAESGLVALKMLEREPCTQNERMRVSWVREVEVLKVSCEGAGWIAQFTEAHAECRSVLTLLDVPHVFFLPHQHISHPSIVRFIASFSTPRHHNLVLEHVGGGEVFEFLARHHPRLAAREWLVRRIFGEVAHAVGWMHSIHLVHRDIKLENIILTKDLFAAAAAATGEPVTPADIPPVPLLKISDFGLSRFVDPASPMLETRCGSEEYAAPELIIGKRYDGRATDVWALGVVLYALLCGFLPFLEDSAGGGVAAREGGQDRNARERKAHLLRIAKGDLRWPALANDKCLDVPTPPVPQSNRLITPAAKHITARLLRRDAAKRAAAWDVFEDPWMRQGSFERGEVSAAGQDTTYVLPDPRSSEGRRWLQEHARVIGAVADVARDD